MFFLQKSIQGAVMILVIVVIRALFINKLPKRTFLILWAAAVFCLLFPFSIKSRFSIYSLMEKEGTAITEVFLYKAASGFLPDQEEGTGMGAVAGREMPSQEGHFTAGMKGLPKGAKQEAESLTEEGNIQRKENVERPAGGWALLRNLGQPGLWRCLWALGAVLCAGYFGMAYFRGRRIFAVSLPVKNETADKWLAAHTLRRKITIRQSGCVSAPLTYGIFSPVILIPENTDWERKERVQMQTREGGFEGPGSLPGMGWELSLCLEHEFVHIKRLDGLTKLILIAALCLHWFNPLVWVMVVLANRDLELSCDEAVVWLFGEQVKSAYARTLIHMEEIKSGCLPLCSNFSKNAIEERITAIMKIKKISLFTAAAGVLLVMGITIGFATRAAGKGEVKTDCVKDFLGSGYTQEEAGMLEALWFEDYENMTVTDFQEKAWTLTDSRKYLYLEERLSNTAIEYEQNEIGGEPNAFWEYFKYIYEPLTAEKWQAREFGGYARKDLATSEHPAFPQADLEYFLTLSVLKPEELTVKEYNDTRLMAVRDLQEFWQQRTVQELADEEGMEKMLSDAIKEIENRRSSKKLAVSIDYYFNPADVSHVLMEEDEKTADITLPEAEYNENGAGGDGEKPYKEENEWEHRQYPYGTREDYDSLLALGMQDYENMTLAAFNDMLLDWCNRNPEAMERVGTDVFKEDYQVELTEEEKRFAALTVQLSRFENAARIKGLQTGEQEEDPWWGGFNYMEADEGMWCRLYFQFSYHISDKTQVTVGERDRCIEDMMARILSFWQETELEERIKLSEEEAESLFETWAEECSSGAVTIKTDKDRIQYETTDERKYHTCGQAYLGTVSTNGGLKYYLSADAQKNNSKYFHLTVDNHTEKEISGIAYAMLAYNGKGEPLEVYWFFMDSGKPASYECIVEEQYMIGPGETLSNEGGWSICDLESPWGLIDLNRYGEDYRVAYVLSCITQITFEDGTQWTNPDYESWRAEYCGKQVPQSALSEYSRQEYEIFVL